MARFVLRVIVNAIALWLTTLILAEHVAVVPYAADDTVATVLTYLLLGLIFGLVNGVIGNAIRIVAFPLYVLTLGLISLIVNGLLFWLVAWISGLLGFGLFVTGEFWWGIVGAVVLGIIAWLIGIILRPFTRK